MAHYLFIKHTIATLNPLTLFCAGMGSGKSNIISNVTEWLSSLDDNILTTIMVPSEQLMIQMRNVLKSWSLCTFDWNTPNLHYKVRAALGENKNVIVLFTHSPAKSGVSVPSVRCWKELMATFRDVQKLLVIDEIDYIVTSLTGGINAKLDHSSHLLKCCESVLKQRSNDLNLFDSARLYGVKIIGFSGTANNLISSKLPSIGYMPVDTTIINVFPIKFCYDKLNIKKVDTSDMDKLMPHFKQAESNAGKVLIIVSNKEDIKRMKFCYKFHNGTPMDSVTISGENGSERNTDAWQAKFCTAKYVFGINLVGIGFDLSTLCTGQEFCLGVLCREMSDKLSQPLSKNGKHPLHMEDSAAILQALARLRKGGTFLVPGSVKVTSLYDGLVEVFNNIRDGRNECLWVGVPRKTQKERFYQSLLLALIQNVRSDEDREVVLDILCELKTLDGRDFKTEYMKAKACNNPSALDVEYWISALGRVWSIFLRKAGILEELVPVAKLGEFSTSDTHKKSYITQSGGGGQVRIKDERITEQVKQRANGVCGHCGVKFEPWEENDRQVCHIKRNDWDGNYTLDNLIYGHKDCDAAYDACRYIYDPFKRVVWRHKKVQSYNIDMNQFNGISHENLRSRFDWSRMYLNFPDDISSETFSEKLMERGYERVVLKNC